MSQSHPTSFMHGTFNAKVFRLTRSHFKISASSLGASIGQGFEAWERTDVGAAGLFHGGTYLPSEARVVAWAIHMPRLMAVGQSYQDGITTYYLHSDKLLFLDLPVFTVPNMCQYHWPTTYPPCWSKSTVANCSGEIRMHY